MNADEVRHGWATRSAAFSPGYYAYYGPDAASEAVRQTLDQLVAPDAAVLELGCSSGRHLQHLLEHGYGNLYGVDINEDAFDVMAREYPDLASAGTFFRDAIEHVVPRFEDGRFDVVFSVETLQHIHPEDEWVFEELVRVADKRLLTVECEEPVDGPEGASDVKLVADALPLYFRDWERVFTDLGFVAGAVRPVGTDTLRVFRPPSVDGGR